MQAIGKSKKLRSASNSKRTVRADGSTMPSEVPYPSGWRTFHCHCDGKMVGRSELMGCKPETSAALVASAISFVGSPGRRGSNRTLKSRPVTCRADSITS